MSQMKAVVDKLLSNVSSRLVPAGHIAEQLLPRVESKQNSGKIGKHGLAHLRVVNTVAGGRGKYRRVETTVIDSVQYLMEGHGLEGLVTEDDYNNKEQPFDAEKDETDGITTVLQTEKEYSLATALANTSVVTQNTTLSGTAQFSDYANSDVLSVAKTAKLAVRAGCGLPPDTLWMDWNVAETLRYHPQLLDFLGFKDARPGGLKNEELARALGVKRILVAEAVYNSAKEGQTDVIAPIWGKHMWFGVCPEAAQKDQVSAGYRVEPTGKQPRKVYKWDVNNPPNSKAILVEDKYDQLITNVGAIYLIKNAIA
jgi:hypothetical protein